MEVLVLLGAGLAMGLLGGLLGIGGSVVLIPTLVLVFGAANQHLYQAAAMICIFCVAGSSLAAHRKAQSMVPGVLKRLISAALVGVVLGVTWSNSSRFSGSHSYLLTRTFGAFLVYVACYNSYRFYRERCRGQRERAMYADGAHHGLYSIFIGLLTGLGSGLLGIGAGTVVVPLQQLLLKMPLRQAISHSAATIVSIAWLGAIYKNATLGHHDLVFDALGPGPIYLSSLKIAALVFPTALLGGFAGGHLTHKLPIHWVRGVFILVVVMAAVRLLTVGPN